jgi:hypothetical protein
VRTGTLILLLLAPFAQSQETELARSPAAAYDRIATCVDEVESDFIGLHSLPDLCPGFDEALVATGYADFISEDDAAYFDWNSLRDLHQLADRYRRVDGHTSQGPAMDLAMLPQVLEQLDLEQADKRPLTWGQRVRRWLDTLLRRGDPQADSWLARWLSELDVPQWVGRSIVNVAIAVVLLIALLVIASELRAARIFRRGRTRGVSQPFFGASAGSSRLALADVAAAPPGDRPALLLRLLVETLVATGRLQGERTLTHGELATRATFDGADQRTSFGRVAALCERILYGNRPAAADEIDAAIQSGSTLNEQLRARTAAT